MNDTYWDKNYKKVTKKIIGFNSLLNNQEQPLKASVAEIIKISNKIIITEEWFEPINSGSPKETISENIQEQENKVIEWIEKEITPKAEANEKGEIGEKGLWMELLLNWIKQLTIELAGKALEYLAEKGVDWAADASGFALEKLQGFLYDKYLVADDKKKEIFKNKILEKFPDSGLADKLRVEEWVIK